MIVTRFGSGLTGVTKSSVVDLFSLRLRLRLRSLSQGLAQVQLELQKVTIWICSCYGYDFFREVWLRSKWSCDKERCRFALVTITIAITVTRFGSSSPGVKRKQRYRSALDTITMSLYSRSGTIIEVRSIERVTRLSCLQLNCASCHNPPPKIDRCSEGEDGESVAAAAPAVPACLPPQPSDD